MLILLISTILSCIITWIYCTWVKVKGFWKKRGVSHLQPHPIFGGLTFLLRKNVATWMIEMNKHFKAPYVGTWLFWRPALIINSPEIARNVLIKDFTYFKNRFSNSGAADPMGRLNLFTVNDPMWSLLRRRLTSAITSAKLKLMQPLIDTKTMELLQRIKNTKDKTKISLKTMFADYSTDIFATSAFGVKTNATLTGKDPIRTITTAFTTFNIYRGLNWISIFFFPRLADIFSFFGFTFFPQRASRYFEKVFNMVSQQRLKDGDAVEHKDLLDVLLHLKKDAAKDNEDITDEIILAQAAIFLLGGSYTTASIVTFAMYELTYHQDLQEKLYIELKNYKDQNKVDKLETSKLSKLPYLNAIIKEVLRKYPPMGWIDRVAAMDYKVDDNLTIPKGTPVYVNAVGMQYDNNMFADPGIFNPDRFLPENKQDITPFSYLPFGEGPRNCIGMRFAHLSILQALTNIILNYKLFPLPGAPKPHEVEFEKYEPLLVAGNQLQVNFVARD